MRIWCQNFDFFLRASDDKTTNSKKKMAQDADPYGDLYESLAIDAPRSGQNEISSIEKLFSLSRKHDTIKRGRETTIFEEAVVQRRIASRAATSGKILALRQEIMRLEAQNDSALAKADIAYLVHARELRGLIDAIQRKGASKLRMRDRETITDILGRRIKLSETIFMSAAEEAEYKASGFRFGTVAEIFGDQEPENRNVRQRVDGTIDESEEIQVRDLVAAEYPDGNGSMGVFAGIVQKIDNNDPKLVHVVYHDGDRAWVSKDDLVKMTCIVCRVSHCSNNDGSVMLPCGHGAHQRCVRGLSFGTPCSACQRESRPRVLTNGPAEQGRTLTPRSDASSSSSSSNAAMSNS
jgi:hypothetical protein